MTDRTRIWILTVLVSLYSFGQAFSDEVRHFTSPELRGTRKAVLEIAPHQKETLTCLWSRQTPQDNFTTGLASFEIKHNRFDKVWEDSETFMTVRDFDTDDLNGDGRSDFVVSGYERLLGHHIVLYLNEGGHRYRKQLVARPNPVELLAVGDVNGDNKKEVVFAEITEAYDDWYNMELKIGSWKDGNLSIQNTGITKGDSLYFTGLNLGDVDGDGKEEALVSTLKNIRIYDLDVLHTTMSPSVVVPRIDINSLTSVNGKGQIIQLEIKSQQMTSLSLSDGDIRSGGLAKVASVAALGIDTHAWSPFGITVARSNAATTQKTVILSNSKGKDKFSRQITIFDHE